MSKQIFVTVTPREYTHSDLRGPFESIDEARRKVTDGVDDGLDGYDTRYTFFEVTNEGTNEVGYVLFYEEYETSGLETKREEHFPNHDVSSGVEDRLTNFSMIRDNQVDS